MRTVEESELQIKIYQHLIAFLSGAKEGLDFSKIWVHFRVRSESLKIMKIYERFRGAWKFLEIHPKSMVWQGSKTSGFPWGFEQNRSKPFEFLMFLDPLEIKGF